MIKKFLIFSVILCAAFFLIDSGVYAAMGGRAAEKFKHADKNKDGTVDRKEWHMEKKWEAEQQVKDKSKTNTWWEKRADTDGNGTVDNNELTAWKNLQKERIDLNNDGTIDAKERRLCWRHAKSKVNTAVEKKYDENGDGWLEPEETKKMLSDKHTLIKTEGRAKVDSEIEAEYDANGDGIIDGSEANALKEDIGLSSEESTQ